MRRTTARHQRGFTLIELGIALAVGVGLITVVVMSWQRVRENMMVEQTMAAIDLAAEATRAVSQGATAQTALLTNELVASNMLPESMIDRYGSTPTLKTPWGTVLQTRGQMSSSAAVRVDAAWIRLRGMPVGVCQRVLAAIGPRTLEISDWTGQRPRAHQNDPLTGDEITAFCATQPATYTVFVLPM